MLCCVVLEIYQLGFDSEILCPRCEVPLPPLLSHIVQQTGSRQENWVFFYLKVTSTGVEGQGCFSELSAQTDFLPGNKSRASLKKKQPKGNYILRKKMVLVDTSYVTYSREISVLKKMLGIKLNLHNHSLSFNRHIRNVHVVSVRNYKCDCCDKAFKVGTRGLSAT